MDLLRLWHTLRWLKPIQFWSRARRLLVAPTIDLSPAPAVRQSGGGWKRCPRRASMTGPATFTFFGIERKIASPTDWNNSDWPKLWLYNAHYFDDLSADDFVQRSDWHREALARWIAENPPGCGNGWEPYTVSLRTVNLIKWAYAGGAIDDDVVHSMAVQIRCLVSTLETHLLGNHLWANAKALIFAGTYFEGREADSWRKLGIDVMRREVAEQILADGGHFELSPMYQAILLEDILDLIQLGLSNPRVIESADLQQWTEAAGRMHRWLLAMTHPDGGGAFFNDSALGSSPELADLSEYAGLIGLDFADARSSGADPVVRLVASGYVRLQVDDAVLIADVARVGPDYIPGHGHADTLSFEFSLYGQRLMVNGGTSTYENVPERLWQRGTAAHNTVELNGKNSSEVWSSFRVARRANPFGVSLEESRDGLRLEASHDGYMRMVGRPIHSRSWLLAPGSLVVNDRVSARGHRAIARFRLHPSWRASADGVISGAIDGQERLCRWSVEGAESVQVVASTWSSGFGKSEPCQVIEVHFHSGAIATTFAWDGC